MNVYSLEKKRMPRTEEANQQIRDERKAQILEVSLKLFARKGLTDTRIADIAAATGMSQGLIYRYFASKEEVFAALVEAVFAITLELVQQAQLQPGTALDKMEWLTLQLLPYQYQHPEGVLVVIHALVNENVPAAIRETALSNSNRVQALVAHIISDGQAAGEISNGNPQQLTILYFSTLQGLASVASFLDSPISCFPDANMVLRFLRP